MTGVETHWLAYDPHRPRHDRPDHAVRIVSERGAWKGWQTSECGGRVAVVLFCGQPLTFDPNTGVACAGCVAAVAAAQPRPIRPAG